MKSTVFFRKNRTQVLTLIVLLLLLLLAIQGMSTKDWVITALRGLSFGAITFLTAAGLSLILGLMDVLNLAHGALFMIGAYVAWTMYVRPDTMVDLVTPLALISAAIMSIPFWDELIARSKLTQNQKRLLAWGAMLAGVLVLAYILPRTPLAIWDAAKYDQSPIAQTISLQGGTSPVAPPANYTQISAFVGLGGLLLGGLLIAAALGAFAHYKAPKSASARLPMDSAAWFAGLTAVGLLFFVINDGLTAWLVGLNNNWLFAISVAVATGVGFLLGALMESTLIRPLYSRPMYQLMLTLGMGVIGIEVVRGIWGRSQIDMPKPDLFNGSGAGCPAKTIGDWFTNQCSTLVFQDGRIRTYSEIFIILVGIVVLIFVWLVIQRSRLGMVIRAGVQDREMVEALGINVRSVFTLVFGLGVALAALGGALAGPSLGISPEMGEVVLLGALIALVIGGLTSFPGAAAGAVIVGLVQQFIIKYGSIGIQLPFMTEPFKPSPPLVPASTLLLMVVILLVLPQGLFGRKD